MPNWCENDLDVELNRTIHEKPVANRKCAEILKTFSDYAKSKTDPDQLLDFNQFIPMPESLHITSGTKVDEGMAIILAEEKNDFTMIDHMLNYPWTANTREELIKQLKDERKPDLQQAWQAIDNLEKYGHKDWYSWCIARWGTKWNACDASIKKLHRKLFYQFDTAWAPPRPVVQAMSKLFPELCFTLHFYERGAGFQGKLVCVNDKIIEGYETTYIGPRGG